MGSSRAGVSSCRMRISLRATAISPSLRVDGNIGRAVFPGQGDKAIGGDAAFPAPGADLFAVHVLPPTVVIRRVGSPNRAVFSQTLRVTPPQGNRKGAGVAVLHHQSGGAFAHDIHIGRADTDDLFLARRYPPLDLLPYIIHQRRVFQGVEILAGTARAGWESPVQRRAAQPRAPCSIPEMAEQLLGGFLAGAGIAQDADETGGIPGKAAGLPSTPREAAKPSCSSSSWLWRL